jgi:UDPglucose 6-dehydrogenase
VRICVYGLWHLGSVTAACLAEHFEVIGCDPDHRTVSELKAGRPPIFEPGLEDLVGSGIASRRLTFSEKIEEAVVGAHVVWITFDTPVNEDDTADVEFVRDQLDKLFPFLPDGSLVIISSQVPVGFTATAEASFRAARPGRNVTFAYSPENLRLGKALDAFRNPARVIIGTRDHAARERLTKLFSPFCQTIEWMSVESAEMTKHGLNAFLATSVTFINELATLCELTGADAHEVARGLKSEPRIGPRAYLNPGGAFAGGTLARDVVFLNSIAKKTGLKTHVLPAVLSSNDEHKHWTERKLNQVLGSVAGKTIAVLGLTYKPGTNTLRRSTAVELCVALTEYGAHVRAFDPSLNKLPDELHGAFLLRSTPSEAFRQADAVVVATEWPDFRTLQPVDLIKEMKSPVVVDPNRFLAATLDKDGLRYFSVGKSTEIA